MSSREVTREMKKALRKKTEVRKRKVDEKQGKALSLSIRKEILCGL